MVEKMSRPNSNKFHCPANDGYNFPTAKKCFNHMVKDACAREEVHSRMFAEHEAAIGTYHREVIFAKPAGVIDDAEVFDDTCPALT